MLPTCAFADFEKNFEAGRTQIVWQWTPADLDTPVSACLKLCADAPYSFLFESVEGGAVLGRYSAIGFDPDLIVKLPQDDQYAGLPALKKLLDDSRIDFIPAGMPPMSSSGLFGYLGYGMIGLAEDIRLENPDPLAIPQAILIRPAVMVIFDNVRGIICVSTPVRRHRGNSDIPASEVYAQAQDKLESCLSRLRQPLEIAQATSALRTPLPIESGNTANGFKDTVKKAIEYIKAGDIFQVVPSIRFSVPFDLPSIALYRSLRRVNPSPFLFHLQFEDFSLVGSSPEIMVRVRDRVVTIRPIAGTRKRGRTDAEDKALAADLLADPKERAEHLMLLDLGRNDVGRVAATGSVRVTEQFSIENYSHVMHIVSNVEGRLADGLQPLDALFAGFPAGTVSGAPKIRAMQIIEELEPVSRSFYGGCVGYLDGGGDVDTCIALRTALVKDGRMTVQAGAGIVADSDPESEYRECENKARALIEAAELALAEAAQAPAPQKIRRAL